MRLWIITGITILGKVFFDPQFSTAPLTAYDLLGLCVIYCIVDEFARATHSWWRIRQGLDQWPNPSGSYYDRWLKLRNEDEPDYYIWLAIQKNWQEPWRTWARQDQEAWERWEAKRFINAGFTWEAGAEARGWLSRDPFNNDWILWDTAHKRMLRRSDEGTAEWQPSRESIHECIALAEAYMSGFEEQKAANN